MNNTSSSAPRHFWCLRIAAALIQAAALLPQGAWAADAAVLPAEQESQGVSYVTGGVSLDESTAIKAAMSGYPLVVEVYRNAGGKNDYTASSELTITAAKGGKVFSTAMQGPFALLRLKPGRYQIKVDYEGQSKQRSIQVRAGGSSHATFVFSGG